MTVGRSPGARPRRSPATAAAPRPRHDLPVPRRRRRRLAQRDAVTRPSLQRGQLRPRRSPPRSSGGSVSDRSTRDVRDLHGRPRSPSDGPTPATETPPRPMAPRPVPVVLDHGRLTVSPTPALARRWGPGQAVLVALMVVAFARSSWRGSRAARPSGPAQRPRRRPSPHRRPSPPREPDARRPGRALRPSPSPLPSPSPHRRVAGRDLPRQAAGDTSRRDRTSVKAGDTPDRRSPASSGPPYQALKVGSTDHDAPSLKVGQVLKLALTGSRRLSAGSRGSRTSRSRRP